MVDDEEARRRRAERLREEIDAGTGPPRTPREFTERAAREAAAEERRGESPESDRPEADEND